MASHCVHNETIALEQSSPQSQVTTLRNDAVLDPQAATFSPRSPESALHHGMERAEPTPSSGSSLSERLAELARRIRAPPPSPQVPDLQTLKERLAIQTANLRDRNYEAQLERLQSRLTAIRRLHGYVKAMLEHLGAAPLPRKHVSPIAGQGEHEDPRQKRLEYLSGRLLEQDRALQHSIWDVEQELITEKLG